jgi:hypothetical protein
MVFSSAMFAVWITYWSTVTYVQKRLDRINRGIARAGAAGRREAPIEAGEGD